MPCRAQGTYRARPLTSFEGLKGARAFEWLNSTGAVRARREREQEASARRETISFLSRISNAIKRITSAFKVSSLLSISVPSIMNSNCDTYVGGGLWRLSCNPKSGWPTSPSRLACERWVCQRRGSIKDTSLTIVFPGNPISLVS